MAALNSSTALRIALDAKDTDSQTKKSLFIFGVSGYVGRRLAKFCSTSLQHEFVEIGGSTRARSNVPTDFSEYVLNEDGSLPPQALDALDRATHVLSTVPTSTDNTLSDGRIEWKAKLGKLHWAGYLSTTAVYGDRGGALATEDDEVSEASLSPRGKERHKMEEAWLKTGAPVHIFRLPGIYGPGRGPLAKARERSNRLLVKEGQVFCRVHVDDVVQALILSMRHPNPGRIYNICDDLPAASHEVSLLAHKLLEKEAPKAVKYEDVEHELSPMVRSFYGECKRITNDRVKLELNFCPIYPTFEEGFRAQFEEERATGFQLVPTSSSQPVQKFTRQPAHYLSVLKAILSILQLVRVLLDSTSVRAKSLYERFRYWYVKTIQGLAVIFVDNGSVRPSATLGMRRLAGKLNKKLGVTVHPTSWRYADRIDPLMLTNKPAEMFSKVMEAEKTKFVVTVPFFLGPSSVVTRDIPKLCSRSTQIIAQPLVDVEDPVNCEITELLVRSAHELLEGGKLMTQTRILMVDHGSPSVEVNRVRRALGARLRARLYPAKVVDCSMERREDAKYDFNEPTLEHAFELGGFNEGQVLVLPVFLFEGNHAGPGGDIERIISEAVIAHPLLQVRIGRLLMDEMNDDAIVSLIEKRIKRALL